jgi:hypothetical protein
MKIEQSRRALLKTLICPSYRITKASGSGDLLSRSLVHTSAEDGVDYGVDASNERQNLYWFRYMCHGNRVRVYIGTTQ